MFRSIINKISDWWQGKPIDPPLDEIFHVDREPITPKYKPHWSASLARFSISFWLKRWPILLPVIAGAAIALFIHFDSKPTSEPEQKENHQVTSAYHVKNLP